MDQSQILDTHYDIGVLGQIYHLRKQLTLVAERLALLHKQKRSTSLIVLRFAAFYPLLLLANLVSDFSVINWDLINTDRNFLILLEERG